MKQILMGLLLIYSLSLVAQGTQDTTIAMRNPGNDPAINAKQQSLDKKKSELAELEKKLADKSAAAKNAVDRSNESMSDNTAAAKKLERNPHEKKYSRKSKKAAKEAKRNAKKARVTRNEEKDLEKAISKKRKAIEKEEKQLAEMQNKNR